MTASPAVDPVATGLRLLVRDGSGTVLNATIPGGAFDPLHEAGWTAGKHGAFIYRSPRGVLGIAKVTVKLSSKNPGQLTLAVVAARPDLVLVVPSPGNRDAVHAVERTGIRVVVVQDRTLEDLWTSMRTVAAALDLAERGEGLVTDVQRRLEVVRGRVAGLPPRRVLLVVGHTPLVVAGRGSLQDELVSAAGGVNIAADVGGVWPQISLELVVARAPEVIVDAAMGSEAGRRDLFAG